MKNLLVLAAFINTVAFAHEANVAKSVWIARLTGQAQCQHNVPRPGLGEALSELEQQGIVVQEGKVGRLSDRAFCAGCDCPEGTFHLARVESNPAVEDVIQKGDWQVVDAKTVNPTPEYTIQPVVPQI